MDVLELVRTVWPILSGITPFILMGGFYWLRTQFVTRDDHRELDLKVDGHHDRIGRLETEGASEPSRADLNRMQSDLAGRIGGVEVSVKALGHQMTTMNQYLHTVIEKGLAR